MSLAGDSDRPIGGEYQLSIIEARNQPLDPSDQRKRELASDAKLNCRAVKLANGWVELDQGRLTTRTLVLSATPDIVVPPEFCEVISANVPGAKRFRFKKSGHGCLWDERDLFMETVRTFLVP
jgi:pimeloyl-ACP methyl ester carboxylesterase